MNFVDNEIGCIFDAKDHCVFFGNKDSSLERLTHEFPSLQFLAIQQVHGDTCIQATNDTPLKKADAHWTDQKNSALLISTADCLPILCFSSKESRVLAIHAGWRGILNKITLSAIQSTFKSSSSVRIYIGPHIQQKSFEIEKNIAEDILGPHKLKLWSTVCLESSISGKVHLDLFQVLHFQLIELGLQPNHIQMLPRDTFSNPDLHSYRRDRQNSGRNRSFIFLK